MKRRLVTSLALVGAAAALLTACGRDAAPRVSATAMAGLRTLAVAPRVSPVERRLDGTIEAVNQGTVAAQTSGRVTEILYDVNDFVPAGAVIVRLRATEQRSGLLQADAALREAEARAAEARTRHDRVVAMYERQMVAKSMLDESTATRDAAIARLAAAKAAVDAAREGVAYTEVRAPYAGIVTQRHVQVGETVAPGSPLMSGLSLRYLRVVVDVPQSVVEQVRRIRKAAVYVNDRRVEASRLTIFPEASASTNTFRARLELPENAADLYPGMFVKAGFVVGEAERLWVPATAVVERGEVTSLYVLDGRGRLSLRQVRLGLRTDAEIEVLSGLRAGELIALDPDEALRRLRSSPDTDVGSHE